MILWGKGREATKPPRWSAFRRGAIHHQGFSLQRGKRLLYAPPNSSFLRLPPSFLFPFLLAFPSLPSILMCRFVWINVKSTIIGEWGAQYLHGRDGARTRITCAYVSMCAAPTNVSLPIFSLPFIHPSLLFPSPSVCCLACLLSCFLAELFPLWLMFRFWR